MQHLLERRDLFPLFCAFFIATKPLSVHFSFDNGKETTSISELASRWKRLTAERSPQASVAQAQLWKRLRINPVFNKLLY
jgi:hypothetical protein